MNKFLRQAVWQVGDKRCFYCRELVLLKNTHLDHVIPSKLFQDGKALIIAKYGLMSDFDFNGVDNLVISCASCNSSRKRATEYEHGIPIWLEEIQKLKNKILDVTADLERRLALDLPDEYKEFFLSCPDFMPVDQSISEIRKKDIPLFKNISIGEHYYPLHLVSPDNENEKILINTFSMYKKYADMGYYALTTPEIALSSLCETCLEFFDLLENAQNLEEYANFEDYWKYLPYELLGPTMLGDEPSKEMKKYTTLEDFISKQDSVQIEMGDDKKSVDITVLYPEYNEAETYRIKEVLQADFTGTANKHEAILFIHYKSPGTLNFSYSAVVAYSSSWKVSIGAKNRIL